MTLNLEYLRQWIGRTESQVQDLSPVPATALSATLDQKDDRPQVGDPLPYLWHWLYFLRFPRQSDVESDGLTERGGFLPPVPLPRIMHAGSRLEFSRCLRYGQSVRRESRIVDLTCKEGRTGPLVFLLVRYELSNDEGLALTEDQEFVYRERPRKLDLTVKAQAAPSKCSWSRQIMPDEMLLFRFSALTFNGHRIHYDRRYATEVDGYPDLVVQGRLIVMLLADLLRRNMPDAQVKSITSRALRPLFVGVPFSLCGHREDGENTVKLWASDVEGNLATEATVVLA
jgi:3-methylfumaryl-CoA hydratase